MATYKSEVLYRSYHGRRRPVSHYSLGWLPRWISVIDRAPRVGPAVINGMLAVRPLSRLILGAAGIDRRRSAPRFAPRTFHRWWRRNGITPSASEKRNPVVLWVDSFTDGMDPRVARAAISVLEHAGYRMIVPDEMACCGLTWITTGQLGGARKRLLRLLDVLEPFAAQGIPIVGLEPSCTAVLRSDLLELMPDDPRAATVAGLTRTLAEQLTVSAGAPDGWRPPDLTGLQLVVQPHCHHHSVLGFATDRQLLTDLGASLTVLSGCCGLAGNFGMEKGHYDMSVAVAETALLPALRDRAAGSIVLADGFSCRTQVEQLAGLTCLTLSELLAGHLTQ
jgi:Fe-S oxidoreductase